MAQTQPRELKVGGVVEEVLGSWSGGGDGVEGMVLGGARDVDGLMDGAWGRLGNWLGRWLELRLGRWLELLLGLGDRGGGVVVGFRYPEADARAGCKRRCVVLWARTFI